jgi:GNAT superfamily N-acetyltransferase
MIDNTSRTVLALDGDRVVGFARALCDEVANGYISMVVVAADRRRQGIGRELIRLLIKGDEGITWVLRAGRGSAEFWKSVGFSSSEIAMERLRTG